MRSGVIQMVNGYLETANEFAYNWSATALDTASLWRVAALRILKDELSPSFGQRPIHAFHVRELVHGVQVQLGFFSVGICKFLLIRFASFVRGGLVDPWYGSSRLLDLSNYYWASTAYPNDSYAYHQSFNSANVLPSHSGNRANGFSVRCLAL